MENVNSNRHAAIKSNRYDCCKTTKLFHVYKNMFLKLHWKPQDTEIRYANAIEIRFHLAPPLVTGAKKIERGRQQFIQIGQTGGSDGLPQQCSYFYNHPFWVSVAE